MNETNDKTPKTPEQKKKEFWNFVLTLLIAAVIAFSLRIFVFEFVNVKGPSMEPTLLEDETVLMEKISYKFGVPSANDILICDIPSFEEGAVIKRVIGVPGDVLAIKDGVLYKNDAVYTADVFTGIMDSDMPEILVEEGTVFVMGDNRNRSLDSRATNVGPIHLEQIRGKAALIILPFDKITSL